MIKHISSIVEFKDQTKLVLESLITKLGQFQGGDITTLCMALKESGVGSQ